MNHFILLIICFLSVELLIRANYFDLISSTIKLSKKALYVLINKKISDHWKENTLPIYSMQMMKSSLHMLLVLLLIILIFFIADIFFNGFLEFTFSINGIIESILLAFSYAFIRKQIEK